MQNRCLYCYQLMDESTADFHPACSKTFFEKELPPSLDLGRERLDELAKEIVLKSITVTGVQPKLSLAIEVVPGDTKRSRFTIVGLWGHYILKPPTSGFPHLPENEDCTMHLAAIFGLPVAEHSLIRLSSGELAYITKRFDREGDQKLAMEDMCQLTETLTADKYHSSMEKVGRHVRTYATSPGLAAIAYFELSLFSWLTGNADMHLKNFALLTDATGNISLAPAYDMVCTRIAMPDDKEELALTLNARKRKITLKDFDVLAANLKIPAKSTQNTYARFAGKIKEACNWIDVSFLPEDMKGQFKEIILGNAGRMKWI
ncbi:HipA domain-containing protein [Terrimonas sp. NA20]|uniref:HipA domain-containing protein n=1 Tax=Terrimonas ginsenosidimutans TaxID=2908004 RepID=A0ABS9KKG4_9BACT|nr:HipA domain-containing protein [Terrimonas ginsenosidimutans]MCG2612811.1 HipA domain-containing protein [Terrimonas ginsenosidimutans]